MPDAANDPVLEALWGKALEAWHDEKVHAAVLEHGVRTQALSELAARYRAVVDDPIKGALARKKLEAVATAATQMLLSTKTPRPGRVPLPITLTAFALFAIVVGWITLLLWGRR